MRKLAGWFGLLSLSGLALLTVSSNIRATQRSYTLGRLLREQDDLIDLISSRSTCCREMASTRRLAQARERLALSEEGLYTEPAPIPALQAQSLALGPQSLALGVP